MPHFNKRPLLGSDRFNGNKQQEWLTPKYGVVFQRYAMNNIIDEYVTILDSLQEDYAELDSLMFNDERFDNTVQYADWSLQEG